MANMATSAFSSLASAWNLTATSAPVKGGNWIQLHQTATRSFGKLDPVCVCFLQLVSKRYPLKAVRTLEQKKQKKKEIIPFGQNLLVSITSSTRQNCRSRFSQFFQKQKSCFNSVYVHTAQIFRKMTLFSLTKLKTKALFSKCLYFCE